MGKGGVLTSPNFGSGDYPTNLDYKQTIQVVEGKTIKIHFTDWDVARPSWSQSSELDYVTFTEGDGSTLADIRPNHPDFDLGDIAEEFVSKTDTLHVLFHTSHFPRSRVRTGWRLVWGEYKSALFLLK